MNLKELNRLPPDLIAQLDPAHVRAYLESRGWVHLPELDGFATVYERPESRLEQLLIPVSHDVADFVPRMAEAVVYAAEWEHRSALALLSDLLASAQTPGALGTRRASRNGPGRRS